MRDRHTHTDRQTQLNALPHCICGCREKDRVALSVSDWLYPHPQHCTIVCYNNSIYYSRFSMRLIYMALLHFTVYMHNEFVIEYTESQFADYFRSKKQLFV